MTINHEALKKRRAGERQTPGWKAKENGNKVRILPPHSKYIGNFEAMTDLAVTFKVHFFRIEGKTEIPRSRCLAELKKKCPACEMWRAHWKSTDPGLAELAKSIRASDQYLFNILDLNNLQQGIQPWPANYTCWDKIMEIAANPAWGNVVDPADGVDFEVTMTPGSRSRSGHNAYSVLPSPQRTNIQAILDSIPDWKVKLDLLEEQISAAKEPEEINEMLDEMGFPPSGGVPRGPTGGGAPAPTVTAPTPVSVPAPVPVSSTPAPVSIPGAGGFPHMIEPAMVAPAPSRPNLQLVQNDPALQPPPAVHYDPGPSYVNQKGFDVGRPDNAPRCYGDYNSEIHRCAPCPVKVDCQLKLIGAL